MKKSLWKRVLALVLCLALSAGYLPVPSFAEEPEEPVALQQEAPVEEPKEEAEETQEPTTEPTTEPTEESTEAAAETTEATEATTEPTEAPIEELPEEELMEAVSEEAALNEDEPAVASVTIGTNTTYHPTLQAAFDEVKNCTAEDNAIVKLLADVTLKGDVTISGGVFTLASADTESKTLHVSGFFIIYGGTVTLGSNVTIRGAYVDVPSNAEDATVVAVDGAEIEYVSIGNGTLEMKGGKVTYGLDFPSGSGMLKYTGGTVGILRAAHGDFRIPANTNRYEKISALSGATLSGLLGEGCAYQDSDGKYLVRNALSGNELTSVAVVKCTHSDSTGSGWENGTCKFCDTVCKHTWTDGKCDICGKECDHQWEDGKCTNCQMECTHEWNDNGVCEICTIAAAVKITWEADGRTAYYTNLHDALKDNQGGDARTVTLESDITLTECVTAGRYDTFTLNTNGKHIICDDDNYVVVFGEITLTGGGTIDKLEVGKYNPVKVIDAKLGILSIDVEASSTPKVRLSGGSYGKICKSDRTNVTIPDLLAEGYAYRMNGAKVPLAQLADKSEVVADNYGITVVKCDSHDYDSTTGACKYCGTECKHPSRDQSGLCTVCKMQAAASITTGDDTAYFATLEEAINAAGKDATVTLLTNVRTQEVLMIKQKGLTLDLNGKTLDGFAFYISAKVTVIDGSAGADGKIGVVAGTSNNELTVRGGTIDRINSVDKVTVAGGMVGEIIGSTSVTISGGTIASVELYPAGTLTVTGGTVESVTLDRDSLTLSNNGSGTVKNVILDAGAHKRTLSGGPFEKLQITSDSELASIDLTQFAPDGQNFYFTTGRLVKAGNIAHTQEDGKHIYTISGPVEVKTHTHSFNENTHECICGESDMEAKFNGTFYATLAEAIQALQEAEGGTIVLLKDLDTIQMTYTGTFVPTLDLNGHTVGTLVANRSVDVENNAQKIANISFIRALDGYGVYVDSNVTVENVTLDGGYITNDSGTVKKVTVIKSSKATALYGGPFDEVYIQSDTQLTQLNLSTFAYGNCLQKNGTAVSAADVLVSGEQKDGSYVYSLGGPITVSEDHSCDLTTGLCPCGWTGVIRVGDKVYDSIFDAFDSIPEGVTITLLRDVTESRNPDFKNNIFDWNGHTWTNNGIDFWGTVTLTDNSAEGGGGVNGTVNLDSDCDVTIAGGNYSKVYMGFTSTKVRLTGGSFGEIENWAELDLLPVGYALRSDGDKLKRDVIKATTQLPNVTVEKCEDHDYGSDGKCKYCLSTALASVRDGDQKVRYYNSLQEAFNNANDGETITLLADREEEVTVSIDGARTLDLGGHTLKSLKSTGTLTLTVQGGGSVDSITLELSKTRLLGGPFGQVVLSNVTDPSTIDVAKLTPDGIKFLYTGNYEAVTAGDFKAGTDGCVLTGPVEGHIVHAFDPNTGICLCGESRAARIEETFYETLQEAVDAAKDQDRAQIVVLKDDAEGTITIPSDQYLLILDLNGHTLGTLNISRWMKIQNYSKTGGKIASIISSIEGGEGLNVNSGVTIESVTLEAGSLNNSGAAIRNAILKDGVLDNYSGAIDSVTIVKSEKSPKLYCRETPIGEVRIASDTRLTNLYLPEFVDSNGCFIKDGKSVSAAEVFASGSYSEQEGYVYFVGKQLTCSSDHTCDKDTGLCPCGYQAPAKVNGTVYQSFGVAWTYACRTKGSTLTLLRDIVEECGYGISDGHSITVDWNGYTANVSFWLGGGSLTLKDSRGGGGIRHTSGSCIMLGSGQLTIEGGSYNAGSYCPIQGYVTGAFDRLTLPAGYLFYDQDNNILGNWKTDGFANGSTVTVKKHTGHTLDENNVCTVCGLTVVATVTEGDQVTDYSTLAAALTAAAKTSGATVQLLKDETDVTLSSGTFTLDWNGHSVTALTVTGGTVTLTGATGGVTGTTEKALDIQGGTVTVQSGSYNNVYVEEAADVTVAGGSFYGKEGQKPITAVDMSKVQFAVGKLVKESYYRKLRPYTDFETGSTLTVEDCTEHYATSGDTCYYCATELEASVSADGNTVYIGTFEEALAKAQETTNSTLTLLRDMEITGTAHSFIRSGAFTIDWNGHTVKNLVLNIQVNADTNANITLKSSKDGGGIVGNEGKLYIDLMYGTATIDSGIYSYVEVASKNGLSINGGTFGGGKKNPIYLIPYISSPFTVPTGYVFYDQNNNVVSDWQTNGFAYGSTVTLKYHENHTPDENGKCICGLSGAAVLKVTDYWGNFTETPYNDFTALQAAASAGGADVRLTLWVDVRLDTAETIGSDSNPFTIDWNGKKVVGDGSFTINSAQSITLTDSQSGGGMEVPLTINGKVTLEGGRYKAPITLGGSAELTLPLEKAFHDESGKVMSQADALKVTEGYVSVADHDHKISGCDCGRGVAAVITANGQDTPYSTLAEAVESIQSGGILTLMSDGTLESEPSTWAFTLDLGGHTLDTDGHNPNPGYQTTFTLKDSADGGVLKLGADGTGRIELTNFGTMILESGTVAGNIEVSQSNNLTISGGTVTGTVDPYMGNLTITGGTIGTLGQAFSTAKVTLHGGTFGKLDGCDRYMLEEGYALYDGKDNVVNIGGENVRNVTIKVHTHDFSKGTCPCGGITSGEGLDLLKPDDYETLQMLGYQVNGEEVQLQPRTWGGKEYLSRYDGEPLKNAIVQTYTWDYNANNDAYPTGMKVYRVVEVDHHLELKEETALKDLLEYIGVSIRCTGKTGIRISTGMTKANKSALTGAGLDGFKLVQYGTVAAWSDHMGSDSSLVLGKSYSRFGYAYNCETNLDNDFKTTDTSIEYTNVLINYPLKYCGIPIVFRPFAVLERDDGTRFTIYGGQLSRSISGIAQQVLNDPTVKLNDEEKAYVESLVKAGMGDSNG